MDYKNFLIHCFNELIKLRYFNEQVASHFLKLCLMCIGNKSNNSYVFEQGTIIQFGSTVLNEVMLELPIKQSHYLLTSCINETFIKGEHTLTSLKFDKQDPKGVVYYLSVGSM
jgi:hypothetical protein